MAQAATRLAFALLAIVAVAVFVSSHQDGSDAPPRDPLPFDEVDQDVIAAVVQREFQNGRSDPQNAAPLVLLSDVTMVDCNGRESPDVGIDCFVTPEGRMPLRSHRGSSLNLGDLFRNMDPRRVALPPMPAVRLISTQNPRFQKDGRFDHATLLQAHPSDTRFFVFTAPVYLSQRQAAVLFRAPDEYSGVAYLVRKKSGWVIRDLATRSE